MANTFIHAQDALFSAPRSNIQIVFKQTISATLGKDNRTRSCHALAASQELAYTVLFPLINVR